MSVTLRDARQSRDDREWIRAVYPAYLADLASAGRALPPSLAEWGVHDDEPLADWFSDYARRPLVIVEAGRRVGFALVSHGETGVAEPVDYRMSEFFVTRAERGRGVGAMAATMIFRRFAGRWEVLEDERNAHAVRFWRRVIADLTAGGYRERRRGGEVRQSFNSAASLA